MSEIFTVTNKFSEDTVNKVIDFIKQFPTVPSHYRRKESKKYYLTLKKCIRFTLKILVLQSISVYNLLEIFLVISMLVFINRKKTKAVHAVYMKMKKKQ